MITFQDAVFALVPNAQMIHNESKIVDWHDTRTQPTEKAIQDKLKELQDKYDALQYQRNRSSEYPPIGDQLDALYHAGVFPKEMADKLKAVKDKYKKLE